MRLSLKVDYILISIIYQMAPVVYAANPSAQTPQLVAVHNEKEQLTKGIFIAFDLNLTPPSMRMLDVSRGGHPMTFILDPYTVVVRKGSSHITLAEVKAGEEITVRHSSKDGQEVVDSVTLEIPTPTSPHPTVSMEIPGSSPYTDKSLEVFIERRIATINTHDRAAYLRMVHPTSLAAVTPANQDVYEAMWKRELAQSIPAAYTMAAVTIPPEASLPLEGAFKYPMRPTHWVTVEYVNGPTPNDTTNLFWAIIQVGKEWYVVEPTPTAATLEQLRRRHVQ